MLPDTAEQKLLKEINTKNAEANEGIDLDLIPEKEEEKPVDKYSYTRSQRAVEMRVTDELTLGAIEMKSGSMDLVKRLNGHIAELDSLNAEKRTLSEALLEQIKFVRSLQAQLGTADNGEITEVIDKELEE